MLSDADGHLLSPKESLELIALRARVAHLEEEKDDVNRAAAGPVTNNIAAFQAAGAGLYRAGMEAGRRASMSDAEKIRSGNGLTDTHVVDHATGRVFAHAPAHAPAPESLDRSRMAVSPATDAPTTATTSPKSRPAASDVLTQQKLPRGSIGHVLDTAVALASATASNSIIGANEERRRSSGWAAERGQTQQTGLPPKSERQESESSSTAEFSHETNLDNVGGEVVLKRTVDRGFGILFGCSNGKTVVSGIKGGTSRPGLLAYVESYSDSRHNSTTIDFNM